MANDALILFVIMLGCVLIAAAICWVVWGRARNALEIELTTVRLATERELAELSDRCETLELTEGRNADELARCEEERKKLQVRCAELGQELKDVTGQLADAKGQLVDLKLEHQQVHEALGNSQARISEIEARPGSEVAPADESEMAVRLREQQSELAELIIERDDWRGRYESLEKDYREHGHGANAEELNHLRERLAEALERCKTLKIQLGESGALAEEGEAPAAEPAVESQPELEPAHAADPVEVDPVSAEEGAEPEARAEASNSREETLVRIASRADRIDLERIGRAGDDERDDLTRINGIGPFVEKKLNALGICTFAQLARLTDSDQDQVNEVIEFFPGRIRRDDWTGQARRLCDQIGDSRPGDDAVG